MNKTLDQKLYWLAGIIDGEGCLTMRVDRKAIASSLRVEVASNKMVEEIDFILSELEIKHRIESINHQLQTRPAVRISIDNKEPLKRFLEIISGRLIVKKPEADLMLLFLERSCSVKKYRYSEEDFQVVEALKYLKKIA
jgi:intein/homing endonuclease